MSDNLTLWVGACRYYMGRRTYAVSDFCSMLRRNWQSLDEHTKAIIQRDVEEEFDRDDLAREAEDKYKPLGDDCDRREWEAVRRLWIGKYTAPPERKPLTEERNFCPRCGKRTNGIHTCTPPAPLTDEVIADLWHQNGGFHHHFARAIERWLKGNP